MSPPPQMLYRGGGSYQWAKERASGMMRLQKSPEKVLDLVPNPITPIFKTTDFSASLKTGLSRPLLNYNNCTINYLSS